MQIENIKKIPKEKLSENEKYMLSQEEDKCY